MDFLEITSNKLNINEISELVLHESCGALSVFGGTTRDIFDNKQVLRLEYETSKPMAIKYLKKICVNIRSKWPDIKGIAIYHRTGTVPVKEFSVVIAISSPHRQSGLNATQFAIDELKRTVPIWKKEIYSNEQDIDLYEHSGISNKNNNLDKKTNCCYTSDNFKHLTQISAPDENIKTRIEKFIKRKREENDKHNKDYFSQKNNEPYNSCARVHSTVHKRNNFKSHLKIFKVDNISGPQMNTSQRHYEALDKLINPNTEDTDNQTAILERLDNIEEYLNIETSSNNLIKRIKVLEDKLIELEGLSPEYMHFARWLCNSSAKITRQTYTLSDLDLFIEQLNK